MRLASTLTLFVAGMTIAADAKDDEAKELKRFAGTWTLVSGEKDGQKLADEHVKKSKITWKGKEVIVESPHQSKEPIKATMTRVDASKKPAEMDWERATGPDSGKKMVAIYEWLGDDSYRIIFAPAGKDRPKEFTTKEGSGHIMHVWKRAKEQ
ncbi:MAG: TIGR03067 domain-containing protein [Gemmataceae bacterium]|nr:TIGR03067 domain-containing protein [Gemmataceae bacterium]